MAGAPEGLADALTALKDYSRAEKICRRVLAGRIKARGADSEEAVRAGRRLELVLGLSAENGNRRI
ncbi:MAG: hypothetical protein LBQ12_10505 [Deltaproteobacteria bacterium]|nr:hypothetical protein [Deltaproteobacteria bacterium]